MLSNRQYPFFVISQSEVMTDFRQDQTNERTEVRVKPLILKVSGARPTLPYPLSLKVNTRGWKVTDLADGEYCINNVDDILYWRSGDQIFSLSGAHKRLHALNNPLDHSSTIPIGHLMDADVNGLPRDSGIHSTSISSISNAGLMHIIPTGYAIVVKACHQYLVKDALYITGSGSITVQGSGQIIIY